MQWVDGMHQLVASDELANDVTGAEALLERHQDYRTEVDARTATFMGFQQFGDQLVTSKHYASDDVRQRCADVDQARRLLEVVYLKMS
jgi:spectrin alpha